MSLIRSMAFSALGLLVLAGTLSAQQTGAIAGRVLDAGTLAPVSGAMVTVAGTGGLTGNDGRFLLTGVPAGSHQLRVVLIGYAEQTREVEVAPGETVTVELRLQSEAVGLGQIVVTSSYETQEQRDLTGVIETVSPAEFNTGRNISPEQLIQGKVAGVQVFDTGEPGGGMAIRIRGGTSINASNEPLFVIDGVPVAVGGGLSAGRNPLNFLNPNEIASMTVLKDASATAIYGSRGANGVVLVETLSGRSAAARGGSELSYSGSFSSSSIAGEPQMLSTPQFLQAVTDYAGSSLDLLGDATTDWRGAVQRTGVGQEHNVGLAGAVGDMTYRLSLGYLDQEGVLHGTDTERATIGINYGQNFLADVLRVTANVKGAHSTDRFTPGGVINNANIYAPTQPIYDPASPFGGFFEWYDDDLSPVNPVAELTLTQDEGTTLRSLGDLEARVAMPFLPDLSGTVRLGYDVAKTSREVFRPTYLFGEARGPTPGYTSHANNTQISTLLDAFVNYGRRLEGLAADLDITAGYTHEDASAEFPFFEARGLEFDYLGTSGIPAAMEQRTTNWVDENRLISFFGRANMDFRDRYLFTLTVRRDGSSRFGPQEQWGTFPSAAFAWRVSDEAFLSGVEAVSDLKLRGSWGVNGNQAFANYQQFSTYALGEETAQYQFGDVFVPTIRPGAADPGIKWEETTSWNIGMDLGILENRLTGAVDYYYKETEDLIFRVPVAAGTNLSNFVTTNIGTMRNSGFELSLEADLFRPESEGFWWTAMFNASTNDNELLSINPFGDAGTETILTGGIAGGVGNFIQILRPGLPVNSFYVYQHVRDASGLPVWGDTDGNGTINDFDLYVDQPTVPCADDPSQLCPDGQINVDDRVPFESPQPDWIFGHTTLMGFGDFDASMTLRAYVGNHVYNNIASNYGHYRALRYSDVPNNLHASVLETGFEREQYFSDYYVEDASFLRMDNLTLGYRFDTPRTGSRVRVFGTAQNLFTLTEYRGVDPTAGVNGIDNNLYPRSRTFTLGATVQF